MNSIKRSLMYRLRSMGIYERLKVSSAYDLYLYLTNRGQIEARAEELEFYRRLLKGLRRGDTIFDVGANVGKKTELFLRLGAQVIAIEPDEGAQKVLRDKFLRYRFNLPPVRIIGLAVGAADGEETMWIDGPGSALNTLSEKWTEALRKDGKRFEYTGDSLTFKRMRKVETATLETLISRFGKPFYIKVDVEGYELNALRGLRGPVPYVSFEVNLPEFKEEGRRCVQLLDDLTDKGTYNYAVDCNKGLAFDRWSSSDKVLEVFEGCTDRCVEVFWRSNESDRDVD
jgi:FkbM family methyltransferase